MAKVRIRDLVDAVVEEMGLCEYESVRGVNRAIRSKIPPRRRVVEVECPDLVKTATAVLRFLRSECDANGLGARAFHELLDLEHALGPYAEDGSLRAA